MASPRFIQDQIHTETGTSTGVWKAYRDEITGGYLISGASGAVVDWDNHLMREYNKKVSDPYAETHTGLLLNPYDVGFAYTGTGNFNTFP